MHVGQLVRMSGGVGGEIVRPVARDRGRHAPCRSLAETDRGILHVREAAQVTSGRGAASLVTEHPVGDAVDDVIRLRVDIRRRLLDGIDGPLPQILERAGVEVELHGTKV